MSSFDIGHLCHFNCSAKCASSILASTLGMNVNKLSLAVALALCTLNAGAKAQPPSADEILDQANQYTVKIRRVGSIGFNQDPGTSGHATGFLVDRNRGWILTNAHVASRSPVLLTVSFKGERYISARRVFVDRLSDVAVLEIDPNEIPAEAVTADLQCQALPRVGTPVAIFGHPRNLSYTATRGIISSISWVFPIERIQSDAIVNGGNSGGPLIDLSTGKIVGIATASYRDTNDDHSTAVSFSEPIPPVCEILELLKAGKDASYRQLPAVYATAEDDDRPIIAKVFDPTAGLKIGDRILAVNGRGDVRNTSDLASRLRGNQTTVDLVVERDGQEVSLTLTTSVMPEITQTKSIDLSGVVISNQWRLDSLELQHEKYPFIDFVRSGSAAELTQANAGQYLVAINNRTFTNLDKLFDYVESLPAESEINLILKAASNTEPFTWQYHLVTLPWDEPRWINASQTTND